MKRSPIGSFKAHGFGVYVAAVILALGIIQLAGSLVFYQLIDRQTLQDDHARRVAELLVVGQRMHKLAPDQMAANMTTRYLAVDVSPAPNVEGSSGDQMLSGIGEDIIAWEPSLAGRPLHLSTSLSDKSSRDLEGSLQLDDGTWLNFVSRDITSMWPVAWRAMVLTTLITAAFLAIGLALLYLVAKPLRSLTDAAERIGQGRKVQVAERGPRDLRDLAHAMNAMQERIDRILSDQTKSYRAIGHDLRTPLSRLKTISGMIEDKELVGIHDQSVDEMVRLLDSLESYLGAQLLQSDPEEVNLGELLVDVTSRYGEAVTLIGMTNIVIKTFKEPLKRSINALIENAVQFAGSAEVAVRVGKSGYTIDIIDQGPGVDEDQFPSLLEPFFRVDQARQRNTDGFGLGIPTAHILLTRFNGSLKFSRNPCGGLTAHIFVPNSWLSTA